MRSSRYVAGVVAVLMAGCPARKLVQCAEDEDCDSSGGGICTLAPTGNRWCSFPDPECPSGMRFSDVDVGDGLSDACVEETGYLLTVHTGGNGRGTVTADSDGLSCSEGTCQGRFLEGETVNLSATAIEGMFLGWSDSCRGKTSCVVTMDRPQVVGALFGVPGEALWVTQLGGLGTELARSIAIGNDDALVTVGIFSHQISIAGTEFVSSQEHIYDGYVVKMDTSGAVIWAKQIGGMGSENLFSNTIDAMGNVYVTGSTEIAFDFGNGRIAPGGFVVKLDPSGNLIWSKGLGSVSGAASGVATATKGDAVVVTARSFANTNDELGDILVLNLSASTGDLLWSKTFSGPSIDQPHAVAFDSTGNIIVVGDFLERITFGSAVFQTTSGHPDGFLLKLSGSNGTPLMSRHIGSAAPKNLRDVAVDSNNNIVVIGDFEGTLNAGCATNPVAAHAQQADIFLLKYTQAGSCTWARAFTGTGDSRSSSGVAINEFGDIAVTGQFCGTMSLGGPTLAAAGVCPKGDIFAVRLSGDGTHLNSVRAGGTSRDSGLGIAQSSDGRFFVSGIFENFSEFGGNAITASGGSDAFVVGLAPL